METSDCLACIKFFAIGAGIETFLDAADFHFAFRFGNIPCSILIANFTSFAAIGLHFRASATICTATSN